MTHCKYVTFKHILVRYFLRIYSEITTRWMQQDGKTAFVHVIAWYNYKKAPSHHPKQRWTSSVITWRHKGALNLLSDINFFYQNHISVSVFWPWQGFWQKRKSSACAAAHNFTQYWQYNFCINKTLKIYFKPLNFRSQAQLPTLCTYDSKVVCFFVTVFAYMLR